MTFPSGPSDQGFPEQPGFSQQPGFGVPPPIYANQPGFGQQPGWRQQPGYPGGYQPAPPRHPSRATAIIAGILALLIGLPGLGITVYDLVAGNGDVMALVGRVLGLAVSLTLGTGAILLFRRKMIGRWLVVGGCAPSIALFMVAVGAFVVHDRQTPDPDVGPVIAGLIAIAIPSVALVLALVPATARWIRSKPNPVAAQHQPPYPGY